MPPSSSRRVGLRSRREPDAQLQSDADTPESISTPSRKKRRLNGAERSAVPAEDAPRARITESVGSNDSNATLPDGGDADVPSDPVGRQNLIIQHLRAPSHYTPNAAIDYANEWQAQKNQGNVIPAYAKIAARDWCFFVTKTTILIGRVDAALRPHPPSQDGGSRPLAQDMAAEWGIDIDLGPERQISRVHAQISFDTNDQTWYIHVNSRNGLKLDDVSVARGSKVPLHSGICICIMGTQMLFLLANQTDNFHPMLWRQVKTDPDMEGESDKDGNAPSRSLPHAHPGGPTPKRERYDPFPPSSHPRTKHSSQAYSHQLTSTPGRLPPATPLLHSSERDPRARGSPTVYPRGMMIDSTEDIDYSQDSAKDIKPPHSYAQLIGQAILSSPEEMLTLANIYQFIRDKYAFFRYTNAGWQNSIRHNLSLSKSFEKVARRTDEPGKGMKWKIVDSEREDFIKKQLLNPRKGGGPVRLDSSGPSSPALNNPPSQATERLMGAMGHAEMLRKHDTGPIQVKSPPRSATPPLISYPLPTESFTPDRGSRPQSSFAGFRQSPTRGEQANFATPAKKLFQDNNAVAASFRQSSENENQHVEIQPSSPNGDPTKPNVPGLREQSANSPPTLYSDPAANNANSVARGLVTPLVSRQAPRLAPPSTAQVPSQFMHFSSPAPFWKYVDLPSTPARQPLELSPIKLQREDGDKEAGDESEPVQPSSPPLMEDRSQEPEDQDGEDNENDKDEDMTPESPTRTVSRPVSRAHLPGPAPQRSCSNSTVNALGTVSNVGIVRGASLASFEEVEDEGGIDLAKGFMKIGSFHRNLQQESHAIHRPPRTDSRTSVSTNI